MGEPKEQIDKKDEFLKNNPVDPEELKRARKRWEEILDDELNDVGLFELLEFPKYDMIKRQWVLDRLKRAGEERDEEFLLEFGRRLAS